MLPSPTLPPIPDETGDGARLRRLHWAQTRSVLRAVFTVLFVAMFLWLGYSLRAIAFLLILSVLFAYVVEPVVGLYQRPFVWRGRQRRIPRGLSIALVYLTLFGLVGGLIYGLLPHFGIQLAELSKQVPRYAAALRERAQGLGNAYRAYDLPPSLRQEIDDLGAEGIDGIGQRVRQAIVGAAGMLRFFPWLVLIPVISFFLLKDAQSFRRSALDLLPQGRVRWRGREFFEEVNTTIAFYVRAQLLACLFIGVVCASGFAIIGVPYALLLGAVAGVLELIPLLGPLTTVVLAGLLASTHSGHLAIWTLLFLGTLRMIHDYAIYPRLISSGIKLHPLAIIVALLCGAHLAGLTGLFLAIPITAVLSVGYRHLILQWGSDGLLTEVFGKQKQGPQPAVLSSDPARQPVEVKAPLTGLRVLVVENEKDGRMLLVSLLERHGAQVWSAGSVSEALLSLSEHRPDVVVSDIGMPGEDGFDLIRQIRALDPALGGNTPVAALTAYATREDRTRTKLAGFQKHLSKPVDVRELIRTVSALAAVR